MADNLDVPSAATLLREKIRGALVNYAPRTVEYRARIAAIAMLEQLITNKNEDKHYIDLVADGSIQIYDAGPPEFTQRRMAVESFLATQDPTMPRYWAVRAHLCFLEYSDRYEMVRRQVDYMKENEISGSCLFLTALLEKWAEGWGSISKNIEQARAAAETFGTFFEGPAATYSQRFMDMVLYVIVQRERSREEMFTMGVNYYLGSWRLVKDGFEIQSLCDDISANEYWCAVTQAWGPSSRRRAVFIVPSRVRVIEMCSMFSDVHERGAYSHRNGLVLETQIAAAFDACRVAIVPSRDGGWEIRVMDSSLVGSRHQEMECSFGEIHGRQLRFLEERRPRADFLHFHWLLCMAVSRLKDFDQSRIAAEEVYALPAWGALGFTARTRRVIERLSRHVTRSLPLDYTEPGPSMGGNKYYEDFLERLCNVPNF
ncbi:hypothetical protein DSL72_008462 [Monilinia vaccinii-corymbosi]|uniref:Uncharacterized protein n=1 Tax=Monilinia vaccinii-corymbosi TaxID=61207 RepID=A0A8A3PJS4_9HELO|nr:hypothetical protein DSL72_008462 [Monilinia vaccinii-corymbosi]